jgi:eukaryotic-like serine/threonine-protein kinase
VAIDNVGRFAVVKKLAEGGMGEVFLVRQRGLGQVERLVVLKRLRSSLAADTKFVTRFLHEARISARLSHPNVVQTYEFGRLEQSYFLTLEHVRGANLLQLTQHLLKAQARWPLDVVIEVMTQSCSGLRYVHELRDFDGRPLSIVHRDISPSNIMLSYEGHAKLLDFGVANARGESALEEGKTIMGKLAYIAPEQWRLGALDARTDLFSLGVIFWELLTGRPLFHRESVDETMDAALGIEIPPPSLLSTGIPADVDAVVLRLLSRDPAQRFATAQQVIDALERIASTHRLPSGPRLIERFMRGFAKQADDTAHVTGAAVTSSAVQAVRILIVDDEIDNLDALRRALRDRYRVIACSDPLEALRIVETESLDMLITDQRMPGMSGIDLIERANAIAPGVLKVILSAYMDSNLLLRAINAGHIHRYIVKPWLPETLCATVAELLSGQPLHQNVLERRLLREQTDSNAADTVPITGERGQEGGDT